jgi:hypothetical protein
MQGCSPRGVTIRLILAAVLVVLWVLGFVAFHVTAGGTTDVVTPLVPHDAIRRDDGGVG